MRVLSSLVAASTLMVAAAPSHAQDFLGGLARSVGSQAAQALVNRAVTAATSGATATPAATPTATPAGPGRASDGLLYDDQGDLVYERRRSATPFDGKAHWRNAAYCVALSDLVDIDVAERRALAEKGGRPYSGPTVEEARATRRDGQDARWRRFGQLRLQIDHPDRGDPAQTFEAEVSRQAAELRQRDWSERFAWRNAESACNGHYLALGSLQQNMENGRGAGSRAPAR